MDEKQREVLERNRALLVNNMIMTEDFFHLLKTEHVLPDTMIKDIQEKKGQEERNNKLLDILKLRGGDVYRKLRHVLSLTGHQFLADHLYGEDIETRLLRAEDVFEKFPRVFQHVSDDTKTRLLKYLETKVREKAVTNAWLTSGAERAEVMESRKILYDAEKDYKLKLETKTKKLLQLKDEVGKLNDAIKFRDEETIRLQKEISDMQRTFKDDLAKQSRFNAANNNSIMQLRERFDSFNERVRIVNVDVRRFLEPEHLHEIDEDPDNVKMSLLERNVRKLIQVAKANIDSTSSNVTEKETVLSILKTSAKNKTQTLSEIVQQYVDKQEKGKAALAKELGHVLDIVRGSKFTAKVSMKPKTDLKWLKSQVAILREEVEHVRKKLEWKEGQLSDLIKENNDLREHTLKQTTSQKVTLPLLPVSHISRDWARDTPDSTRDIGEVYEHFERCMNDAKSPTPMRRHSLQHRGSLADVNLEHSASPPQRSRRQSKFDVADIDILGTGARYRRSVTDLRSTDTFGSNNSAKRDSLETKNGGRASKTHSKSYQQKNDMGPSHDSKSDPLISFVSGEGRRHSLAELITIYENSKDENPAEDLISSTRLPVLQES